MLGRHAAIADRVSAVVDSLEQTFVVARAMFEICDLDVSEGLLLPVPKDLGNSTKVEGGILVGCIVKCGEVDEEANHDCSRNVQKKTQRPNTSHNTFNLIITIIFSNTQNTF